MMNKKKNNRAEIFLSFDSLKGFKDYIRKKERIVVDRKDLLSDSLDELDWKIKEVQTGRMITVIYYYHNDYIKLTGMVTNIDLMQRKVIKIVDKDIPIQDIIDISGEGIDE